MNLLTVLVPAHWPHHKADNRMVGEHECNFPTEGEPYGNHSNNDWERRVRIKSCPPVVNDGWKIYHVYLIFPAINQHVVLKFSSLLCLITGGACFISSYPQKNPVSPRPPLWLPAVRTSCPQPPSGHWRIWRVSNTLCGMESHPFSP